MSSWGKTNKSSTVSLVKKNKDPTGTIAVIPLQNHRVSSSHHE